MLQKLYDLSILVDNYDAKCKLLEYKLEFCGIKTIIIDPELMRSNYYLHKNYIYLNNKTNGLVTSISLQPNAKYSLNLKRANTYFKCNLCNKNLLDIIYFSNLDFNHLLKYCSKKMNNFLIPKYIYDQYTVINRDDYIRSIYKPLVLPLNDNKTTKIFNTALNSGLLNEGYLYIAKIDDQLYWTYNENNKIINSLNTPDYNNGIFEIYYYKFGLFEEQYLFKWISKFANFVSGNKLSDKTKNTISRLFPVGGCTGLYISWYGMTRVILEPLRYSADYYDNSVTSGWIMFALGLGIIALVAVYQYLLKDKFPKLSNRLYYNKETDYRPVLNSNKNVSIKNMLIQ